LTAQETLLFKYNLKDKGEVMKVEEFWNKAFLAALTRLAVEEAKIEADKATALCIAHWQSETYHWAPNYITHWKDQKISNIPDSNLGKIAKEPVAAISAASDSN
jgi:hypothetical protein